MTKQQLLGVVEALLDDPSFFTSRRRSLPETSRPKEKFLNKISSLLETTNTRQTTQQTFSEDSLSFALRDEKTLSYRTLGENVYDLKKYKG